MLFDNLETFTGSPIAGFAYAYDPAGNRVGVVESAGDRVTWTYDAANQLAAEHRTGVSGFRHTFAYDPAGNRTVKNEDSDRTTFTYDPANRLQRSAALSGLTTYVYDAAGNQRTVEEPTGDIVTNTWSYENQNTLVEQPSGDRVTLTYNGDKMQVAREDADESRRFEWDKQNLLLETDDLGTPLARNTHEPDDYGRLLSREELTTSEPAYYHYDALGSTAALSDQSEVVGDEYQYKAWGEQTAPTADPQPYRWVGELGYRYDEDTNRHNLRRRDYDTHLAKFLSDDPIGLDAGDANVTRYVENQPTQQVDPSGLCKLGLSQDVLSKANEGTFDLASKKPGRVSCEPCQPEPCAVWFVNKTHPEQYEFIGVIENYTGNPHQDMVKRTVTLKGGGIIPLYGKAYDVINKGRGCVVPPEEPGRRNGTIMDAGSNGFEVSCWFLTQQGLPCDLPEDPNTAFWCSLIGSLTGKTDFCDVFKSLQGGYDAVVGAYKQDRLGEVISNMLGGAVAGFKKFESKLEDNVKEGLINWLGLNPEIFTFDYLNAKLTDLVSFVVEKIGNFDWRDLLNKAFGPGLVEAVTGVFEAISNGPDWIRSEFESLLGNLSELKEMVAKIGEEGLATAIEDMVKPMLKKLVSLFVPAAGIFLTAYDAVIFVKDQVDKLAQLLNKMGDILKMAAEGGADVVGRITEAVFDFAKQSLGILLPAFAVILGIHGVPEKVKCIIRSAAERFKNFLLKILCKLAGPIRKLWAKIREKLPEKFGGKPNTRSACSVNFEQDQCQEPPAVKPCHGNCWTADTLVHGVDGLRPIPAFKIGDRVLTYTPEERADFAPPEVPEADVTGWRVVELELGRPDGTAAEVSLLRSPEWIAERGIETGAKLFLDLPEMDVEGDALVIAVSEPWNDDTAANSPEPHAVHGGFRGRRITGLFRHKAARVYNLKVTGESPLGVAASHPIWSTDRQAWVPAADLYEGEHTKAIAGCTITESLTIRETVEPVYNIEVDGDHCYRVGKPGILTHNTSAPCGSLTGEYPDGSAYLLKDEEVTYFDPSIHPDGTQDHKKPRVFRKPLSIFARITVNPRGEVASSDFRKWFSNVNKTIDHQREKSFGPKGDSVGHVIGKQFGGSADLTGLNLGNVFPQEKKSNNEVFSAVENDLAGAIRNGSCKWACIEIRFEYVSSNGYYVRPSYFTVRWWIDDQPHTTFFPKYPDPIRISNP